MRPASPEAGGLLERACVDAAPALSASGVGVSVMADDGAHGMTAASDPHTTRLEELQFTCGEGPGIDAFAGGSPVLVADLATTGRWPIYTPAVLAEGVGAVFAFPLRIGAARLGVLDVLRTRAGPMSRADLDRAHTVADLIVAMLLDRRERGTLDIGRRAALFQAQGMVTVQLDVSLADAMVQIRAHAYAENRTLSEVAIDIVARRLRFDVDL